jgi:hypothetical protein
LSGTKGFAQKYPEPGRITLGHDENSDAQKMKQFEEQYTPEIVKHVADAAKVIGGHGGMDFIMDWRLIDCLRNGLPLDEDVYDAAAWSAVGVLSERTVGNKFKPIDFPDFTKGSWKTNKPHDLTLNGGATTGVREVKPKLKM